MRACLVLLVLSFLGRFLLPLLSALFARLVLGAPVRTVVQIELIGRIVPHFLFGVLLGVAASLLLRKSQMVSVLSVALVGTVELIQTIAFLSGNFGLISLWSLASWSVAISGAWLAAYTIMMARRLRARKSLDALRVVHVGLKANRVRSQHKTF
jgi:hypothetical protein